MDTAKRTDVCFIDEVLLALTILVCEDLVHEAIVEVALEDVGALI